MAEVSRGLTLSVPTGKLEWDVTGQGDQAEWSKQVVEGEVVSEEPAVVQALAPAQADVILHEEGRHDTAVEQVRYCNAQYYCKFKWTK